MFDLAWLTHHLPSAVVALFVVAALLRIAGAPPPAVRRPVADGGQDLDHDLKGVTDDLEQLRSGGSDSGLASAARKSDRYESSRQVGAGDVPDLGLGGDGGNTPQWVKYGIYGALIVAILQIYVGFTVPDGTLLVVAALAFLGLGLWAGMHKHEELRELADRFNEWRQER